MVNTITTHENHQRFAKIINQFIWARQQRLKGNVQKALEQEALAEKALIGLCSDLQCTRWADELLTAWQGSLATNPLELEEWQALIYRDLQAPCTEDDLDTRLSAEGDWW